MAQAGAAAEKADMITEGKSGTSTVLHPFDEQKDAGKKDPGKQDVVLEVADLGVRLDGKGIVGGINLTLRKGEILAVIGPSGCGKTTFLNSLNRMLDLTMPGATVDGDILLEGVPVTAKTGDVSDLRKKLGMVFQRPNPFPFSIRKNLEFALKASAISPRADYDARIVETLKKVELWEEVKDRLDMPANALSGGQQQRLCIARALIAKPQIILFDEPCSALDPISSASIERLIVALKGSCPAVVVTHDLAQAKRISDKCAVFWQKNAQGYLVEFGKTHDIFENPKEDITSMYISGRIS